MITSIMGWMATAMLMELIVMLMVREHDLEQIKKLKSELGKKDA